jgi:pilus assembly protein Flp/PilA
MKEQFLKFWNDEEGVTTLEYAILAALLVVGLVAVTDSLTDALSGFFTTIGGKLNSMVGS